MADPPTLTDPPSRGLSRDALLTAGASVASTAVAAAASILIARQLGPVGRGDWAVISSLAVLVGTFGTLGMPYAIAYGLARVAPAEKARFAQAGVLAAAGLAVIAAAVYLVLALVLRPGDAPTGALILGGAVSAALVLHNTAQQAVLTGGGMRWYAAAQIGPNLVTLAAVVAFALLGALTVTDVAAISVTGAATGAGLAVAGIVRAGLLRRPRLVRGPAEVAHLVRPYVGFALLTFATISLTQVVHRIDVLIVEAYKGAAAAGRYAVAVQVSDLLLVIPAALGVVLFRRGATDTAGHWQDALRAVRWTAVIGVAAGAFIFAAAPVLIDVFFGDRYKPSVAPLRWLLPGMVLLGLQGVVSNYVASRGRPRAVLLAWVTAAAFTIVADLLVIPAHGIQGAAAVSSASYLLVLGLHVRPMLDLRT